MGRVAGKVVLITGAASGLGAADARRLAEEGARVVLTDVNEELGREVASSIPGALFFKHDVRDEQRWKAVIAETLAHFGRLDVLVNNAGVVVFANVEEISLEQYRFVNAVMSEGTFLGCKHAIPAMKESGGGSIVNISSVLGLRGASYAMAYCASKGAVRTLTKNVALHCAQQKYNIRCNSVHPGYIDTPMIAPRLDSTVGNMSGRQALEELHPLGRLGQADEVAHMILFLLSDESTFSTGSEFVCDGGLTA